MATTRSGDFKVDLRVYGWFPGVGTIDTGEEHTEDEVGGSGNEMGQDENERDEDNLVSAS